MRVVAADDIRPGTEELRDHAHAAGRRPAAIERRHLGTDCLDPRFGNGRVLPVGRIGELAAVSGHHDRAAVPDDVEERLNNGDGPAGDPAE